MPDILILIPRDMYIHALSRSMEKTHRYEIEVLTCREGILVRAVDMGLVEKKIDVR